MKAVSDNVFIVQGLGGKKTLKGEVKVSGAKNAALPLLASALLFADEVKLSNVPDIEDIYRMSELMQKTGVSITNDDSGNYTLDASKANDSDLDRNIAKRLRASVILAGPMLARFGRITMPHPGGCVIGERPIDIFLKSFEKMGAICEATDDGYFLSAPSDLHGASIFLRVPSVTATETLLMAAVLASGVTVIENAAMEPEVTNLVEFLKHFGAEIEGEGSPTLTIVGSKNLLRTNGSPWKVIPDRIEAGSFLILGALCAEELRIANCEPKHLGALIEEMKSAGVPIEVGEDYLAINRNKGGNASFKSFNVTTYGYPGFPTDLQAPISVFLTQASGEGLVFETIFENRLGYMQDLVAMGSNILMLDAHRAIIKGDTPLKGRELYGPDLRAGLAFIIASLIAEGESRIHNVYYIDRGYERIDDKLRSIGVNIIRTEH